MGRDTLLHVRLCLVFGWQKRLVLSSVKGLKYVIEVKTEFLTAHFPLADALFRVPTVHKGYVGMRHVSSAAKHYEG